MKFAHAAQTSCVPVGGVPRCAHGSRYVSWEKKRRVGGRMEEQESSLESCYDSLESKLTELARKINQEKINALLQEQVDQVSLKRALTTFRAQQIDDYNEIGLANVRIADGVESQQNDLLDRMDNLHIQGSSKFADDLVTDTENILMKQVEMSGKVIENSLISLSDEIYKKKKEMLASYDEEEISKLMDTHFVTLKKYYGMIGIRAQEMRDKYEKIYFEQELESISRQSKEMETMKNRFRNNNKMEEHREDAHKAADELFKDFADKVLRLKVSNSNMTEDQEMRMKETISKSKHWRFEYSHKLESSLQKRIKHADELYLQALESLDHELELLKKFKNTIDMDTVRVKHLASTPRFAHRRYKEEARQTAQMAPTKQNLARLDAYNFKLGNRYVDLANHTRLGTEKQAEDMEKMLVESVTGGHHHNYSNQSAPASEQALQELLRRMIMESQTKIKDRDQMEKLAKIAARKGTQRGSTGSEGRAVIRISKAQNKLH